jgi:hypothetical protein
VRPPQRLHRSSIFPFLRPADRPPQRLHRSSIFPFCGQPQAAAAFCNPLKKPKALEQRVSSFEGFSSLFR